MAKPKFTKAQVEHALRESAGMPTHAAALLKCAPNTIRNYIKRHPSLEKLIAETVEETLDIAEGELIKAIRDGKAWAICFYLKCKGKKRGYVERAEVTGEDGGPINVMVYAPDTSQLKPDEWAALFKPKQEAA